LIVRGESVWESHGSSIRQALRQIGQDLGVRSWCKVHSFWSGPLLDLALYLTMEAVSPERSCMVGTRDRRELDVTTRCVGLAMLLVCLPVKKAFDADNCRQAYLQYLQPDLDRYKASVYQPLVHTLCISTGSRGSIEEQGWLPTRMCLARLTAYC
jgi:hypothetical protein